MSKRISAGGVFKILLVVAIVGGLGAAGVVPRLAQQQAMARTQAQLAGPRLVRTALVAIGAPIAEITLPATSAPMFSTSLYAKSVGFLRKTHVDVGDREVARDLRRLEAGGDRARRAASVPSRSGPGRLRVDAPAGARVELAERARIAEEFLQSARVGHTPPFYPAAVPGCDGSRQFPPLEDDRRVLPHAVRENGSVPASGACSRLRRRRSRGEACSREFLDTRGLTLDRKHVGRSRGNVPRSLPNDSFVSTVDPRRSGDRPEGRRRLLLGTPTEHEGELFPRGGAR